MSTDRKKNNNIERTIAAENKNRLIIRITNSGVEKKKETMRGSHDRGASVRVHFREKEKGHAATNLCASGKRPEEGIRAASNKTLLENDEGWGPYFNTASTREKDENCKVARV